MMNTEKPRILHFNNYGHVALTIASMEVPNRTNWYVLGMSLAHKNDNGSRFVGRNYAVESMQEGLEDYNLQKIIEQLEAEEVKSLTCTPPSIKGQVGHYVVHGLDKVKDIVSFLRHAERSFSSSKNNSLFHKAFFDLKGLYERNVTIADRKPFNFYSTILNYMSNCNLAIIGESEVGPVGGFTPPEAPANPSKTTFGHVNKYQYTRNGD
jgi:hypothetical protein